MGSMVSADTRARIERLLSEGGHGPTAIARLCGVHVGVVNRIREKARRLAAESGPEDWDAINTRRRGWRIMSRALAKRLRRALCLRISPRGNSPAEAEEAARLVADQVLDWCLIEAEKIRCQHMEKWVHLETERSWEAKRREREQRRIQAILAGLAVGVSTYTRDGQSRQDLP